MTEPSTRSRADLALIASAAVPLAVGIALGSGVKPLIASTGMPPPQAGLFLLLTVVAYVSLIVAAVIGESRGRFRLSIGAVAGLAGLTVGLVVGLLIGS